uniref:Aminopeptidase n=2 Tax=Cacopsylla melanoneura TaxID=428564 RepID=A0A8D8Y0U5_9HEMI
MPEKKPFERLPKYAVPVLYDLYLKPNLKAYTFDGITKIDIKIASETNELKLHVIDLDFKKIQLELSDGKLLSPETKLSSEDETITLTFNEILPVGEAKLLFEYTGELNDKMKGFYRSKYRSADDDEDRYMAVTQFESTDARRCFPCWDEPAVKAKFSIRLSVPKDKVALSNMSVKSEELSPDGLSRLVQFETSPIMSSYLVAVVVGEFDYVEETSSDGVLVRVYTPVGKREQGRFALHVASKVLPFYKDYFNISYPLPKIDLVAVPDFSCGAMENWGLVTYREACLLVDSQNTSAITRQNIALVVGHELAHQWFGNLVTMEWWTHLWLNEGYASFVEFLCVHHLFPEYDIWTQFVTDNLVRALELDALKSSHPIEIPVGHPSEVEEIFDDISYNKGASIIRMLQKYIGDANFRKGMHLYLTRHQYGNAFTEDLWASLEEASGKPVGRVMSTWTQQMGFPVISVQESVQNPDKPERTLTLTQHKFSNKSTGKSDSLWYVPISFCTQKNPGEEVFSCEMSTREFRVTIPNVEPGHWVKLNPGTVGYYRVKYPRETLEQFIGSMSDKTIPPLDRLSLLDDLFALVQVGEASTVEVLKMIQSMTHEDNYTVWITICNCLQKIDLLLSNTEYHHLFYQFGVTILKHAGQSLGWEPKPNESHLNTLLRSLIISRLGVYGDVDTRAVARTKFEAHVKGSAILSADLRSPVYRAAIAGGSETTYQQLLQLYQNSDLHEEKDRITRSFGALKDPELLKKVLDFSMSDLVRAQDSVFVIISAAQSKAGRELAWEFLKKHYSTFTERYKGALLGRLVKHTTENFASESRAQELVEFFAQNPTPWIERTVQQSLETIRLNAEWLKRDGQAVKEFLSSI